MSEVVVRSSVKSGGMLIVNTGVGEEGDGEVKVILSKPHITR